MKTQTISREHIYTSPSLTKEEKKAERDSYVMKLSNWCGIFVFISFAGFFLTMKAFGLHEILAFRFLNFVFQAAAVLIAFRLYRRRFHYEGIRYQTGIRMGIHINLLGTFLFAVFMGIYLSVDTNFMEYIQHHGEFGRFMTPVRAAGGVFMESFATGAILTYALMQLFKDEGFNPNLQK
jgi:hypothetical protein